MVDMSDRISRIEKLVDADKYFTINRARQYGKTTTLYALEEAIKDKYCVVRLDFQGIGTDGFKDEPSFVISISRLLVRASTFGTRIPEEILSSIDDFINRKTNKARLLELSDILLKWLITADRSVVLIIDEVDSAADKQSFLDFLGLMRDMYISREANGTPAFQSVILAGVTDVKHLKSHIRDDKQQRVNSPWNIAGDFDIDMSLSEKGICGMLSEYETDHNTGMDVENMARLLREFTGGYPYLVSRICQIIDEKLVQKVFPDISEAWSEEGFNEALKMLLSEKNTLFESLTGKLSNYPQMREALHGMLMEGVSITYNAMQDEILQMEMYGFIKNEDNKVEISNRIFETLLYNLFLSDGELSDNRFSREGAASHITRVVKNRYVSIWTITTFRQGIC